MVSGGHVTVLMDREIMDRNIHALGLESLSSVDIIQRLRYHISTVSVNGVVCVWMGVCVGVRMSRYVHVCV